MNNVIDFRKKEEKAIQGALRSEERHRVISLYNEYFDAPELPELLDSGVKSLQDELARIEAEQKITPPIEVGFVCSDKEAERWGNEFAIALLNAHRGIPLNRVWKPLALAVAAGRGEWSSWEVPERYGADLVLFSKVLGQAVPFFVLDADEPSFCKQMDFVLRLNLGAVLAANSHTADFLSDRIKQETKDIQCKKIFFIWDVELRSSSYLTIYQDGMGDTAKNLKFSLRRKVYKEKKMDKSKEDIRNSKQKFLGKIKISSDFQEPDPTLVAKRKIVAQQKEVAAHRAYENNSKKKFMDVESLVENSDTAEELKTKLAGREINGQLMSAWSYKELVNKFPKAKNISYGNAQEIRQWNIFLKDLPKDVCPILWVSSVIGNWNKIEKEVFLMKGKLPLWNNIAMIKVYNSLITYSDNTESVKQNNINKCTIKMSELMKRNKDERNEFT